MKCWTYLLFALGLLCAAFGASAVSVVTYYQTDAAGTVVAATKADGTVAWRATHDPYGRRTGDAGVLAEHPVQYAGKVEDPTTGYVYLGGRHYDPRMGRFTGFDPAPVAPSQPRSFSRYSYANNNPYRYVDPDGESPIDVAFLVVDLARLGAAVYSGNAAAIQSATLDVGASMLGVASPVPGVGQVIKGARAANRIADAARAASVAKGANKAPDFVVSPGGTAFPVPKGATGPHPVVNPAGNQTGVAFTGGAGGANGQVSTMRVMNPTPARGNSPGYPNGYIKYENSASPKPQGVDPYSGKTLPNSQSHFPID